MDQSLQSRLDHKLPASSEVVGLLKPPACRLSVFIKDVYMDLKNYVKQSVDPFVVLKQEACGLVNSSKRTRQGGMETCKRYHTL